MRAAPGEWDCLRLAAKAADREKAAEPLWPAFEERLTELGYSPRAIAHAFAALPGADSVEEALAELKENERLERVVPVPLEFEVIESEPALPVGRSLTITGVERDGRGIEVTYEVRPSFSSLECRPRVEARYDREQVYRGLAYAVGLGESQGGTITFGSIGIPLPRPNASLLRVRMSWAKDSTFLWQGPAHEVRITL